VLEILTPSNLLTFCHKFLTLIKANHPFFSVPALRLSHIAGGTSKTLPACSATNQAL
jgi:hypothetical protein